MLFGMRRLLLLTLLAAVSLIATSEQMGAPFTLEETTPIAKILAAPDSYVGKTVRIEGKATEVCQMMGCWVMLRDDDGNMLRVKVVDGEIVFPQDAPGRKVAAEGELARFDLTREQAVARARHEAEEQGRAFDPASIKEGTVVYQLQGTGARVVD